MMRAVMLALTVFLVVLYAASRGAPVGAPALPRASLDHGAVDSGNGTHDGGSPEPSVARFPRSSGASPSPRPRATTALERVTRQGIASWVGGYGPRYLALPWGRGIRATICGPGGCWTGRSTDVGPDQGVHPDRVADLSPEVFELVCGVPRRMGLCDVTVTRVAG